MNKATGKAITGLAYLRQRLADVFNTERGSLVGNRDYGSKLDDLVDRNIDNAFAMRAFARVAQAVLHEPNGLHDLKLKALTLSQSDDNTATISLKGIWNDQAVNVTAPLGIAS